VLSMLIPQRLTGKEAEAVAEGTGVNFMLAVIVLQATGEPRGPAVSWEACLRH
jgi:hypothetical protein